MRTTATSKPKVADEVEVYRTSADGLDAIGQGVTQEGAIVWWEKVGNGTDADAMSDMSDQSKIFDYMRSFSSCIASDVYEYLLEYGKLEVFFHTSL